jgi:hypothetical protein
MAFSLYSRRALPFRYQRFLQIPYGEQSSSSHYAYAKRPRVGLSTCATCARVADFQCQHAMSRGSLVRNFARFVSTLDNRTCFD